MALRLKSKNPCRFKLIWPVQSAPEKYSGFHPTQISGLSRPFRSEEGRWPSSRTLERDAVDAATSSRA
jgi:hypothetical protein